MCHLLTSGDICYTLEQGTCGRGAAWGTSDIHLAMAISSHKGRSHPTRLSTCGRWTVSLLSGHLSRFLKKYESDTYSLGPPLRLWLLLYKIWHKRCEWETSLRGTWRQHLLERNHPHFHTSKWWVSFMPKHLVWDWNIWNYTDKGALKGADNLPTIYLSEISTDSQKSLQRYETSASETVKPA